MKANLHFVVRSKSSFLEVAQAKLGEVPITGTFEALEEPVTVAGRTYQNIKLNAEAPTYIKNNVKEYFYDMARREVLVAVPLGDDRSVSQEIWLAHKENVTHKLWGGQMPPDDDKSNMFKLGLIVLLGCVGVGALLGYMLAGGNIGM